MKVITFLNSKGGVGKTTLALNLGVSILTSSLSKDVLFIDTDTQGSLRDWNNEDKGYDLVCATSRQSLFTALKMNMGYKRKGEQYAIIDTPGKINEVCGAAVAKSDLIIIPLKPNALDIRATILAIDLVSSVMSSKPSLKALFVINQATPNSNFRDETECALREIASPIPLAINNIYSRISLARCVSGGDSVMNSNDALAKKEINDLTNEILELLK